jgi:hypothetical protein
LVYKIFQSEESEIYLTMTSPTPALREAEDKVIFVLTEHDAMKKYGVEVQRHALWTLIRK